MYKVFFDFETRSVIDLKRSGAHRYAVDSSTNILCLAWAIDDGPIKIYRPLENDPLPFELFQAIRDDATFVAHNVQFERLIWNWVLAARYGWPQLPLQNLQCTMVMAFSMGLLGSLENAAACLGIDAKKDMKGHRVMLQLSKPRVVNADGSFTWWDVKDSTPELDIQAKYDATYWYCMQDINVLRESYKRMLTLIPEESAAWQLDQVINDRGVYIDTASAKTALGLAEIEIKNLNAKMCELTEGIVSTCNSHAALKKWVNDKGVETESVDKASVLELLARYDLPDIVRAVLELRQNAAKSSVSKIKKMYEYLCPDNRVRGCLQFNGAASTGRWAGRGIQLQNFPRPEMKQADIEDVLSILAKVSNA